MAQLLEMKVSEILDSHPGALRVLIDHGFAPLAQRHLRNLLAHTVTLEQALRLRPLSREREQDLLAELGALLAQTTEAAA